MSNNNDFIPLGKAIAIISVVILAVIVLIGGGIYFGFNIVNSDSNVKSAALQQGESNSDPNEDAVSNTNVQKNSRSGENSSQQYVDGHDFSDSVAWVKTKEEQWHCIDKSGKIILELNSGERPRSSFSNNVALLERADKTIELIDKSGNTISSPKSGEYDEIKAFILELGMILVHKKVITYEVTEDRAGLIDSQGRWQVELCNDKALVTAALDDNRDMTAFLYTHKYIGDGIISTLNFSLSPNIIDYFFNIYTGNSFEAVYYSGNVVTWSKSSVKSYENDYGVFYHGGEENLPDIVGDVYSVNTNGEKKAIINDIGFSWWNDKGNVVVLGKYKDGLFYCNNLGRTSQFSRSNQIREGFYDIDGNLLIDLSKYELQSTPEFIDGFCLLLLRNPQGSTFFTIIDKEGNEMFEPRYIKASSSLSINCGLIVMKDENDVPMIIDTNGKIISTFDKRAIISDYREDVTMVKERGAIYYIDKAGERLF